MELQNFLQTAYIYGLKEALKTVDERYRYQAEKLLEKLKADEC